jgi:hypothetical protein
MKTVVGVIAALVTVGLAVWAHGVHRSVNFSSMRRLRLKASSVLSGSIG